MKWPELLGCLIAGLVGGVLLAVLFARWVVEQVFRALFSVL